MVAIRKVNIKKALAVVSLALARLGILFLIACLALNLLIVGATRPRIYSPDGFSSDRTFDCILVLGAGVRDGKPSDMLRDRLDVAIQLYFNGVAPKLLMSGDHGSEHYDEVGVMKDYAVEAGVPSEDIFLDHAGFSTYESMYRASHVFGVDSLVAVTQEYHLPRALYIAGSFGIDAVGVSADTRSYAGELYRHSREYMARAKDFFQCIFKPEPAHLGEEISINGDGNVTNHR